MRRMLLLVAVSLIGSLAGCCGIQSNGAGCGMNSQGGSRAINSHGICDCEDDDHCASRAPWVRMALPSTSEAVPLPAKLPDGKKKDL